MVGVVGGGDVGGGGSGSGAVKKDQVVDWILDHLSDRYANRADVDAVFMTHYTEKTSKASASSGSGWVWQKRRGTSHRAGV